jgi:acetylornithine deacetylase/succinyl-diaminopimelate desuccinylase-like protein
MGASEVGAEAVELARALVALDTSNPPGNETPAAELLAEHLSAAGAECELIGPDPARLNLVARVPGGGEGPSIMLMAHTDVVPAPRANWTVDPFAAEVIDGHLVGRGAADMKGELAARAAAVAVLARSDEMPTGDVLLVAEADEERNTADVGMSWLVRERPDLRCDLAINEGGGMALELADGRHLVTVSVGEKLVSSLRVRVFGRAGHASLPERADNPLIHAAAAVERLAASQAPPRRIGSVAAALAAIGAPDDEAEAVAWARGLHPHLGELLPAITRLTVTPTGLATHEPANVIPPFADVICDVRALPGQGEAEIRDHVAAAVGDGFAYEVEFLEPLEGGTESPTDTRLFELIAEYVAERLPGAELMPIVTPGFTDSHWVRRDLGTVAYGFAPVFTTDWRRYLEGAHGADESIAVADLAEMAQFHLRILRELSRT